MIYVCTHNDHDFLAPLTKLFHHYRRSQQPQLGHRLLWYLQKTLRGEMYPGGEIEEEYFGLAVANITNWLFPEKILEEVVAICPLEAMYVLSLFFREPAFSRVVNSPPSLNEFFQQEYSSLVSSKTLSPEDPLFIHRCITYVLHGLYIQQPDRLALAYFNFVANLEDKYVVPFDVYSSGVKFFLEDIDRLQMRG